MPLLEKTFRWQRSPGAAFAALALGVFFAALGAQRGIAQGSVDGLKIAGILFEDFDGSAPPPL